MGMNERRKIKFRGKLEESGEWVYGDFRHSPDDKSYIIDGSKEFLVRPETIGQYIGLNDCEGKEIFEGDIVMSDNSDLGGRFILGEMVWCTDLTLFPSPCFAICSRKGFGDGMLGHLEVISNKFDNPKLMSS